jgi:hypothetical protein
MSHYAKVNNGIVEQVIVAEADFFTNFVDTSPGSWIQTSYNTRGGIYYMPNTVPPVADADQSKALRGNFAGIGYVYDAQNDVFYPQKPYPSWILNTTTWTWEAPTPMPAGTYKWNEANLAWELF